MTLMRGTQNLVVNIIDMEYAGMKLLNIIFVVVGRIISMTVEILNDKIGGIEDE
jgi:hypothetical protein